MIFIVYLIRATSFFPHYRGAQLVRIAGNRCVVINRQFPRLLSAIVVITKRSYEPSAKQAVHLSCYCFIDRLKINSYKLSKEDRFEKLFGRVLVVTLTLELFHINWTESCMLK